MAAGGSQPKDHSPSAGSNSGKAGNTGGKGGGGSSNKNPFGKPSAPLTQTPNFPNASPGIVAGALVDALTSVSPLGVAKMIANAGYSATTGKPMSTGMGMDLAKSMGASTGQQSGTAGVGHDFSMDHELSSLLLGATATKKKKPAAGADTLSAPGAAWENGRNPDATSLLMDQILSQSLNPSASQALLG